MTTSGSFAIVYTALVCLPFAMHIALAAGAPLGRFTVGGRFPGRLPWGWRILALVQAGLLLAMAVAVLDRSGVLALDLPGAAFWLAMGVTVLTTVANTVSPSRPERLLWSPVTIAMTSTAVAVALLSPPASPA